MEKKHLSKLTKEELEKELAKHGVPYVYARTKDTADALAKIRDGTLVLPPTAMQEVMKTFEKLERIVSTPMKQ